MSPDLRFSEFFDFDALDKAPLISSTDEGHQLLDEENETECGDAELMSLDPQHALQPECLQPHHDPMTHVE